SADTRLIGGGLAGSSLTYTGAIVLTNVTTVKSRAKNNSTGEWSALTEATFAPSAEPATSQNLVIAEIMYHPPPSSTNELAAGFSITDDFEFLRLLNIGGAPLDLSGLAFTAGV